MRTLADDKNQLYRFFYNTIKIKQPKYFIVENVKGIPNLGKSKTIKQIVADVEAAAKNARKTDTHPLFDVGHLRISE